MKYLFLVALLATICAAVKKEEICHDNVVSACASTFYSNGICNSRYGGIHHIEPEIQAYINSHLSKSYEYLLLATNFNSFHKNRPGLNKLYQGLSDRSFDDTIEFIKQLTRRGGKTNFNVVHKSPAAIRKQRLILEVDELHSLAIALDNEKQLADGAVHVYTRSLHASERDPEMAHYIAEKFLRKQSETVRKLSGYVNDLAKLLNQAEPAFALDSFDIYLQKQ